MSPWLGYRGQPKSHAMTFDKLIDWWSIYIDFCRISSIILDHLQLSSVVFQLDWFSLQQLDNLWLCVAGVQRGGREGGGELNASAKRDRWRSRRDPNDRASRSHSTPPSLPPLCTPATQANLYPATDTLRENKSQSMITRDNNQRQLIAINAIKDIVLVSIDQSLIGQNQSKSVNLLPPIANDWLISDHRFLSISQAGIIVIYNELIHILQKYNSLMIALIGKRKCTISWNPQHLNTFSLLV